MSQFNQEFVEKVRAANDIVEYIGLDVELTQRGRSFVGLCPFHDEKTASFNVSQEDQFYYCFGCGAGGDIYHYIMNAKHVSFPEAVEILANRAKITLPKVSPQQRAKSAKEQKILEVNRLAARYYYLLLRSEIGIGARNYLVKRGIDGGLAKHFYLGFAAQSWDGLIRFLQSESDLPLELAEEAGLIIQGKNGYYDRFRNRIIFPICDVNQSFIGFGGRSVGDANPKYLNTPETLVFHKGSRLYGLNWARNSIRQKDYIVIVEGYTDCISLHAQGITNVAASLGTAFTDQHAKLISRFTTNVVIAFDSDDAGARATQRGIEILESAGLNVKVAPLPRGQDPDGFARSHTPSEVKNWIESAVPYLEYQIKMIISQFNINSPAGKTGAAQEIINIISNIESVIEREEYSNFAANLLSIEKQVFSEELRQAVRQHGQRENLGSGGKFSHIASENRYTIKDLQSDVIKRTNEFDQTEALERCIMRLVMANPDRIQDLEAQSLSANSFTNNDYKHLYTLLRTDRWDKQGEAIVEHLLSLPEPPGKWLDYLQIFRENVWFRSLTAIEEKLTLMENHRESDVLLQFCQLLKLYAKVRREIFIAKNRI